MKTLLKTLTTRLQNRNVILGVLSGVALILVNLGIVKVDQVDHFNLIANTVLTLLVGMGIVSDPESHIVNLSQTESVPVVPVIVPETVPATVPVSVQAPEMVSVPAPIHGTVSVNTTVPVQVQQ